MVTGRSILRNTVWNLLGLALPLVAAVACIPMLIEGLGIDRFGVLSLAWAVIGYFSVFDFGLGRAMTQLVAEKIGARQVMEIPSIVSTGLVLLAALGVLGAALLSGLAAWLVSSVLSIPHALQHEAVGAFYLLSVSIPFVISAAGLRGVLEAHQRFGIVNAIRVPIGLYTFIGPLLVLPFSHELVPIVAVLFAGRIVAWIVFGVACRQLYRGQADFDRFDRVAARRMMNFGGWMTVANLVGPLMTYMDRFVVGSVLSTAAVAFYAAPYDLVTKLLLIPSALVAVLFPTFAGSLQLDGSYVSSLFSRAVKFVFLALFPAALVTVAFAHELLAFWLGNDFAKSGTLVLQLLAVGVLINGVTYVPSALVQGAGRPRWAAILYLVELPFYAPALWLLLNAFGVAGAALAWVARIAADTLAFFWMAGKTLKLPYRISMRWLVTAMFASLSIAAAAMIDNCSIRGIIVTSVLILFFPLAWQFFLESDDRHLFVNFARRHISSNTVA